MKQNRLLYLLLASLLIVAAIVIANFFAFSNIETAIISQIKENQRIETEYAGAQIESHLLQVQDELVTLSKFPDIDELDSQKCQADNAAVHESISGVIDSLLRVDQWGNVIECSDPKFSNYVGLNIQNKDYFQVPKRSQEPFIETTRDGEIRQVFIATPLFETTEYTPFPNFVGEFDGVLLSIVEINELYFQYIHRSLVPGENFFVLANIDSGETILRSNEIPDYKDFSSSFSQSRGFSVIQDFHNFGETIITSHDLFIGNDRWRLMIFTPLESISQEINAVQRRSVVSLGFVLAVIIGILIFLVRLYKSKEEFELQLRQAKVTLDKLGIDVQVETDTYNQADIALESHKLYLVKEDDENHAHELFIGTLNRGYAGLGIVREDPRTLKERYNLHKTSFIWLSKTAVDDAPCETNIDTLFELIKEFIEKGEKSVILLDRLDYILTTNAFANVLKCIHELKDIAGHHDVILIISTNPDLVQDMHLKAIEAETIDLFGKQLKKKVDLSEQETQMLTFINNKNVNHQLVSFKDITTEFKITKPTTRAKVKKLQTLGLLQVETRGRHKSLKITSAGRRVIG